MNTTTKFNPIPPTGRSSGGHSETSGLTTSDPVKKETSFTVYIGEQQEPFRPRPHGPPSGKTDTRGKDRSNQISAVDRGSPRKEATPRSSDSSPTNPFVVSTPVTDWGPGQKKATSCQATPSPLAKVVDAHGKPTTDSGKHPSSTVNNKEHNAHASGSHRSKSDGIPFECVVGVSNIDPDCMCACADHCHHHAVKNVAFKAFLARQGKKKSQGSLTTPKPVTPPTHHPRDFSMVLCSREKCHGVHLHVELRDGCWVCPPKRQMPSGSIITTDEDEYIPQVTNPPAIRIQRPPDSGVTLAVQSNPPMLEASGQPPLPHLQAPPVPPDAVKALLPLDDEEEEGGEEEAVAPPLLVDPVSNPVVLVNPRQFPLPHCHGGATPVVQSRLPTLVTPDQSSVPHLQAPPGSPDAVTTPLPLDDEEEEEEKGESGDAPLLPPMGYSSELNPPRTPPSKWMARLGALPFPIVSRVPLVRSSANDSVRENFFSTHRLPTANPTSRQTIANLAGVASNFASAFIFSPPVENGAASTLCCWSEWDESADVDVRHPVKRTLRIPINGGVAKWMTRSINYLLSPILVSTLAAYDLRVMLPAMGFDALKLQTSISTMKNSLWTMSHGGRGYSGRDTYDHLQAIVSSLGYRSSALFDLYPCVLLGGLDHSMNLTYNVSKVGKFFQSQITTSMKSYLKDLTKSLDEIKDGKKTPPNLTMLRLRSTRGVELVTLEDLVSIRDHIVTNRPSYEIALGNMVLMRLAISSALGLPVGYTRDPVIDYVDGGVFQRFIFASCSFHNPKHLTTVHSRHSLVDFWTGTQLKPAPYDITDRHYTTWSNKRLPSAHIRLVYAATNHNLLISMAVRTLGTRKLTGTPHTFLPLDQHAHLLTLYDPNSRYARVIRRYIDDWDWEDIRMKWIDQFDSLVVDHALPHPKLKLRTDAYNLITHHVDIHHPELWSARWATAKVKTGEIAKAGKPPRVIFDLNGSPLYGNTVAGSLVGLRWVELVKKYFAQPIFLSDSERRGVVFFVPGVKFHDLHVAFTALLTGSFRGEVYDYVGVYFSDDSCVRYTDYTSGVPVVKYGNADISSCDASHSSNIFKFTEDLLSGHGLVSDSYEMITLLMNQLKTPVRIPLRSEIQPGKVVVSDYLEFEVKHPRLYSGSVLTTLMNNMASLSLLIEFFYTSPHMSLELSSIALGYGVVFEESSRPADLQFLKHSPLWGSVNGLCDYYPILNLGPYIRMAGTKFGDVPGSGSVRDRFDTYMDGVLGGMYPRVDCPVVRASSLAPSDEHKVDANAPVVTLSVESFYARYGVVCHTHVLDLWRDPECMLVVDTILQKDYGY